MTTETVTAACLFANVREGVVTLTFQNKCQETTYLPYVTTESLNAFLVHATGKTSGKHKDGGIWFRFPMSDKTWGDDERTQHTSKATGEIYFTCSDADVLSSLKQFTLIEVSAVVGLFDETPAASKKSSKRAVKVS